MFLDEENLSKTIALLVALGLVAFIIQASFYISYLRKHSSANQQGRVSKIDDFTYVERPFLGLYF
ncbi:MAG: hypothetical protein ACM3KM_03340 [Acidobacteriaceae bacterium]